jgi:hypothetical protein
LRWDLREDVPALNSTPSSVGSVADDRDRLAASRRRLIVDSLGIAVSAGARTRTPGWIAGRIGRGLLAGFVGTLAMTLSSTIEMRLRGRPGSDTPAKAAETVLEVRPRSEAAHERLSNLVHLGYGTAWGGVRGALDAIGLRGPVASIVHFALVWPAALVLLPSLRVAPPPTEWGGTELAIDATHHVVYAGAVGATYEALDALDREAGATA